MKTYSEAGVDRTQRDEAKKHLDELNSTHAYSRYGGIVKTPFNVLYPVCGKYHVKTCDGVGTKVLLAQLANKHDTVGIDAIAMVVNDCIRCGATPLALTNVIDIKKSTPELLSEIKKGLIKGSQLAECPIVGGETADVPELLSAQYHINCDCIGEVEKEKIITGTRIRPGNIIVGLRSSGLHSNGMSLARKVLFKEWGGAFDANDAILGKALVLEALEPTIIYVKRFLDIAKDIDILGAVNITGDAYLKFSKLQQFSKVGFEFDNFKPQPIFELIQKTGGIEQREMFSTFNMGWGFAVIVDESDAEKIIGKDSEIIGKITDGDNIVITHNNERIILR
ncbi:MAG: phosphoribosylformylglycinamidine cyclo-ligase [Candidatus Aenigmatarchaeota archaeon]